MYYSLNLKSKFSAGNVTENVPFSEHTLGLREEPLLSYHQDIQPEFFLFSSPRYKRIFLCIITLFIHVPDKKYTYLSKNCKTEKYMSIND